MMVFITKINTNNNHYKLTKKQNEIEISCNSNLEIH
jgi:hypothetical protein